MLKIMKLGETVEECLARLRRLPSTADFPGSGPEWDALVEHVQAEAAARHVEPPRPEERPQLARFDFPPGLSAETIAEALREAYDRIMAAKTTG